MHPIRRRTFLKAVAGAAAAGPLSAPLVRAASPNGALHHAAIGVGGMMGWPDLDNFHTHPRTRIAALCDVDAGFLERARSEVAPDARRYADWRELFDAEGDRIDSVNVTVPDHMHLPIALTAIRSGRHVYCQKPMCHDVAEVRLLTDAAKRAGVRTQLGTQGASSVGSRMAVELIRDGVIGKIERVVMCSNRPGAEQYRHEGPRPEDPAEPPEHLAWDLWLGTAPERPYAPDLYHAIHWRAWQDFGTGWLGDIGCHLLHAVWRSLELEAPRTVTARVQESWADSPERRADTWPQSEHATWTFAGNDRTASDELTVEWYDGEFYPPDDLLRMTDPHDYPPESACWIGTEGAMILPNGGGPQLFPRDKFREHPRPQLPGRHHYHDFLNACITGERTESDFAFSGPMTEAILLGTIAVRLPGATLKWDPAALRFEHNPEADKLLRRTYRDGWQINGA